MKKRTYSILIIACAIIAVIIIKLRTPKTIMIAGEAISLEKPWEKVKENKQTTINSALNRGNVKDCNEVFIKEIDSGASIIACIKQNKSYEYYFYFPATNDIMLLSDEVKGDIDPPN